MFLEEVLQTVASLVPHDLIEAISLVECQIDQRMAEVETLAKMLEGLVAQALPVVAA